MRIERANYQILTPISDNGQHELKRLEICARVCYKSEDKITEDGESAKALVKRLIDSGHEAMLEHGTITVRFICDRAVSHELVRHRMASFAQESQRYCNYSLDKFGRDITFILPYWLDEEDLGYSDWERSCREAEQTYFRLLDYGYSPQQARMVLPNCTKTEIIVTANFREWRHILKLRTAPDAHPDMQRLMRRLLTELKERIPVLFDDIGYSIDKTKWQPSNKTIVTNS